MHTNHSNAIYSLLTMLGLTLKALYFYTAEQVRGSTSQRVNNRFSVCYTSPLAKHNQSLILHFNTFMF